MPIQEIRENPAISLLNEMKHLLRTVFDIKPARHGEHRIYPFQQTDTYTLEQDYVWTQIMKYPTCASLVNTDNPEVKINVGKEEFQNDYFDIELIPDAEHPLILPVPFYLKKGTVISFSNINVTDPTDLRIAFGGYYPIKSTIHNPILFEKPGLKIAKFTGVTQSTLQAPNVISLEDWESFTITHIMAIVRKNQTGQAMNITTSDNFNVKIEVAGRSTLWKETHRWLVAGTGQYPYKLDPPIRDLSGTQIITQIYPPAWGDAYNRKVYIIYMGKMKYRLDYIKDRFYGTVNKPR